MNRPTWSLRLSLVSALAVLVTIVWLLSPVPVRAAHCDGLGGDTDGDDICDPVDNCPNDPNAGQEDADADTLGDACDGCPNDPDNDADLDGVCGNVDNCPSTSNPTQDDADADTLGDACDACPNDPDNDADADGVCGDLDNCPDDANPTQVDADADTLGDACDACPNDSDNDADSDGICGDVDNCPLDFDNDADADGVCGNVDNCPNTANPAQFDTDMDLIGDACDSELYVAATGNDTANNCRVQANPCRTIQQAVDQANPDETIVVAAGLYPETVAVDKPVTVNGAQAGVPPGSRTPGGPAESILDASGLQQALAVTSGDVTIDGLEIEGDAATYVGIGLLGNDDLPNVALRNNLIHGMALANPFSGLTSFAYGIFSVTGSPGARNQITNLVIEDNEIFDVGLAPTSAGAGIYLNNVIGATAGGGASITGNRLHDLATLGVSPNLGIGVMVDAAADDALGFPTLPGSGILISGNQYANAFIGTALLAESSDVVESVASFTGVTALVLNLSRLAGVDQSALGQHVKSNDVVSLDADGYFATIQNAIDLSVTNAEIEATSGTFAEAVVLSVGARLRGAKAGQDARIRDTSSGETIVTQGIKLRASGATVDGLIAAAPSGAAIHADTGSLVGVNVKNVYVNGGQRGIFLERALSASVSQNLLRNLTGTAIDAGTDVGTLSQADDVVTVGTIENNDVENTPFGLTGYYKNSFIRQNHIEGYAGAAPGAALGGQIRDTIVEKNTIDGYEDVAAIQLVADPQRPLTTNTSFKCNALSGNLFGVEILSSQTALTGVVFSSNNIDGNTIGLVNQSSNAVNAFFNWWGCAAGPGNPGCDLIVGPANTTPFLSAASDCDSCFQNADCADGVVCNGAEICNQVSNQCQPGTPPSCGFGGADPDCNVALCVEGPGCTVAPVTDGTVCNDGVACSVADSCQSGSCVEAGGGDGDGDDICALDDNCPGDVNPDQADLDQDGVGDACDSSLGTMEIEKSRVQSASGGPNGRITMQGSLVANPLEGDILNANGTITITITDGGTFNHVVSWTASQCEEKKGKIKCRSADKRRKIQFKANGKKGVPPGTYKMKLGLKKLTLTHFFQGPLSLKVEHSNGLVRFGTATDCTPPGPFLRCGS